MSYIGNTPTNQNFVAGADQFSGTGSQLAFTLSRNVNTVFDIFVTVSNVPQDPFTAYTVAGNTLTFDSAPPSGTNNIDVVYRATNVQTFLASPRSVGPTQLSATGTASSGTFLRGDNTWAAVSVTPTAVSDQLNSSTGYFDLPAGTTAERPGSPVNGMIRYNTTTSQLEVYQNGGWVNYAPSYSISYLVVAGGGGGGIAGGGAGAGGLLAGSSAVLTGLAYSVTVGAGGTGTNNYTSTSGSNSVFSTLTAIGGGRGSQSSEAGVAGGSGGGGGAGAPGFAGGAGTAGQGNNGGASFGSANFGTGGGGGASAVGVAGTGSTSGAGGAGTASSISGSSVTYAGGGGGGGINGTANGAGGAGGGGTGGVSGGANATAGTANRGGGGGGGSNGGGTTGGNGGSGIVIISYAGAQRGTGGTVTSSGGNTIHTFTTSGTYTA